MTLHGKGGAEGVFTKCGKDRLLPEEEGTEVTGHLNWQTVVCHETTAE